MKKWFSVIRFQFWFCFSSVRCSPGVVKFGKNVEVTLYGLFWRWPPILEVFGMICSVWVWLGWLGKNRMCVGKNRMCVGKRAFWSSFDFKSLPTFPATTIPTLFSLHTFKYKNSENNLSWRGSWRWNKVRTKYYTSKPELSIWFIQLSIYFDHTVRFTTNMSFIYIYIYIYIYCPNSELMIYMHFTTSTTTTTTRTECYRKWFA